MMMINDDDDSEIIQSWSAQILKHSSATRGFPTLFFHVFMTGHVEKTSTLRVTVGDRS